EPNSWAVLGAGDSTLLSNWVATAHTHHNGNGSGNGSPTLFADDADNDGDDTGTVGFNNTRVYRPDESDATGLASNALRLSGNNDWALNGIFLRVQNSTDEPV